MYSQAWQDKFVDLVLDKPSSGFYVDVGAGYDLEVDGKINSNSLMFEQRGWKGICVDADLHRMKNRNCCVVAALIGSGADETTDLGDLLQSQKCPQMVDYLSIDIEGADILALKSFLDHGYTAKVITIEHNLYTQNPGVEEDKRQIFDLLTRSGYVRVVDNVGHLADCANLHAGGAFEDWYIHTRSVSYQDTMKKLKALHENR